MPLSLKCCGAQYFSSSFYNNSVASFATDFFLMLFFPFEVKRYIWYKFKMYNFIIWPVYILQSDDYPSASSYRSLPDSDSLPPFHPPPSPFCLVTTCGLCVCEFVFLLFYKFQRWVKSYIISFLLSHSFQTVERPWHPSTLSQLARLRSFLWLHTIPLHVCASRLSSSVCPWTLRLPLYLGQCK